MIYETLTRPEFKLLADSTVGTWTAYKHEHYKNPAYGFCVELTAYRHVTAPHATLIRVLELLVSYPHNDDAQKQLHDDEANTEC